MNLGNIFAFAFNVPNERFIKTIHSKMMKRIHFIEIEDESWCPASIRDGATDYLQFVIEKTNPYKVVLEKLQTALEVTNQNQKSLIYARAAAARGAI